jgi:hypothetical protein
MTNPTKGTDMDYRNLSDADLQRFLELLADAAELFDAIAPDTGEPAA